MGRPRAAALSRRAAPRARTPSDARSLSDQPVVSQGPLGHFRRTASRLPPESAILTRTGERAPGWREGSEARRWRCWYAIRQPQRRWTFPLSTTAALSICRNQRQNLTRPPRLRRPYRSLSCEVVGTGAVVGEVGIGNGLMMTTDFGFGGPCPPPSCATVTVAADDAMTRKVTIAYFILTLLRAKKGAATATSVRDPQRTSPADASKRAASGNCSGGPRNLTSLVRKKIDLPSERRRPSGTAST